jgi:hypothetical protein
MIVNAWNNRSPIFETKLEFSDKLFATIQTILGLCGMTFFLSKLSKTEWGWPLIIACFFFIWIIQGLSSTKTIHLFSDRLVVKRPLFITNRADKSFKIEDLKEVVFRKVKGRFGGPHLIIRSRRINESFRIDFSNEIITEFISKLIELGIKTSKDNM